MSEVIRLLIFMNKASEVNEIVKKLEKSKNRFVYSSVSDFAAFCTLLKKEMWDIILFDYHINCISVDMILLELKKLKLNTPVIAVIENIDMHQAFQLAKKGCSNYIAKGDYTGLLKIIKHELRLAKLKIATDYTSENLYMTMLSIPDGVISVDRKRNIVFINKAAQKYTGWNEQDAIGRRLDTVFNLIDSKTREKVECHFTKLVNSSEKTSFSYCPILISKSGSERYIYVNVSPIKNEDRKVLGAVVTFHDVTCHRQIEEELKIERCNLKTQFQYSPVAMVIVDENAVVQDVNDRFFDMFGHLNFSIVGEKLGKSLGCVGTLNNACGESKECSRCPIKEYVPKVIKSRIPFRDAEMRYRLLQNGNETIRDLKFNLVPINISGRINALISIDDMTEYRIMEENLRRSRDFYLTLFDDFPAMIWRSKTDKSFDYVNKKWLEFTGRTFEQELGNGWKENVYADDVEMCVGTYTNFFDRHEPFKMEYRLKRFDGEYRWVVERAGPYFDLEGNFAGYIGTCYDITEQKQAGEMLKTYELLSEKARDIILVIDKRGNIIEANEAAVRTYGYNREELLSKTIFDLRKGGDLTKYHLEKAFECGAFFDSIHYRKDGSSLPVEVSSQSTMLGGSEVVISIIRDITERKKTEQALRDSEEKFRAIFQNAPYAIFLSEIPKTIFPHAHSKFMEVNSTACRLLGYSREELLHLCPCEILYNEFNEKAPDDIDKLFINGHISYETCYKTKDGRKIPVELSTHSFELSGRKVILTIANDISERKQIELEMHRAMEATKAAYKAKSEFLANMSHEIRTPLNGIIGMLDLTMLTELNHDQADNLATAKTCANSLLKIINDVLDFSKLEAGKMTIEHVEFDFKALMEKIVKVHYYRAKEKGIELTHQLPDDLPRFLLGDPNRLQQVLNNLLSNAVKFTDKGYVSLNVKVISCLNDFIKLQFSVEDTGIGISHDEMNKLFKSFSQIDGSQTRRHGGTGLGLVISKQLIEMLGGNLKVASEKEKGSSFSFDLKFEIGGRNKAIVAREEHLDIGKTKTGARILLVEDDKVNQIVISRMLKEMGYKFDIADSGSDALKLLEENSYDLCLMDIQMPGLDGVQTAGLIRQKEQSQGYKHIPIIAITAHALQGDREKFLSMGMDEYIAKPFKMSDLFIIIEKLLARHTGENRCLYNELSTSKSIDMLELNSYIKRYAHEIEPVIKEISSDIDKLKLMLKDENIQGIEEIAHNIKILASSISDEKLKNHAFRIELAARRGNQLEADNLCKEFDKLFEKYSNIINKMEDSV